MADRGYRGRPQRGERADRQINAGHSRGLDAALSDTEAKIRKLKTERIVIQVVDFDLYCNHIF